MSMKSQYVRLCVLLSLPLLAALAGCNDPITVCPAILYFRSTIPDTTTIKVGASTIAIAGDTWGGCDAEPPPRAFRWKNSDSTVVKVTPLDSLHARIQALRVGRAVVMPDYGPSFTEPVTLTVTVVP